MTYRSAFAKGYAVAAALVMRTHHDENITREIALSFGNPEDSGLRDYWRKLGVDPYDLEAIDRAFDVANDHERVMWYGGGR